MTTFALVHGGNYTSACWQRLTPLLPGKVLEVELPGRGRRPADLARVGLPDFVAALLEDLDGTDPDDVVLVGHSVAGITIAHALNARPRLARQVVLVSCTIPPHGSAVIDHIDPQVRASVLAEESGGVYVLDDATARAILTNDMDDETAALTLSHMGPDTASILAETIDLTGIRAGIPVTYVRLGADATLPPVQQDAAIAALGTPEVVEIPTSGHMAMISHPAELAAILGRFAQDGAVGPSSSARS
jgi:pimeloyl-ACP methyl ester carboxylesterase